MKVAMRADSSLEIGTGHIMRCLTIADQLRKRGHTCYFICRYHTGNIITKIEKKGYEVHTLNSNTDTSDKSLSHSHWLRGSQLDDARQCISYLKTKEIDWLVVDHYALNTEWETLLRPYCKNIMAIDDLADRTHNCDILLDQTYGHTPERYKELLPSNCISLCGSDYILLRPEFAQYRSNSLRRRSRPSLKNILITMGGIDKDNVTENVLNSLEKCRLPQQCTLTVVMGSEAPFLSRVQAKSATMRWKTKIEIDSTDMAQLMTESDLAIGAAGATSWERCCLGLPTLLLVLADNQKSIAQKLTHAGAVESLVSPAALINHPLLNQQCNYKQQLEKLSAEAAKITDGNGVKNVISHLTRNLNKI